MQITLLAENFKTAQGDVSVNDDIFTADFNSALIHQVVSAHLAKTRQGTKAQKTRTEVRGGGRKPWRQKGTGRARAGSIRSPLWKGGGMIFAAKPRDFTQKINKKMYRGAMRSILAELLRQERLVVVTDFLIAEPKTKLAQKKLAPYLDCKLLIVTNTFDDNIYLATRNLAKVDYCDSRYLDPVSLIRAEKTIVTKDALLAIEEMLSC